MAGRKAARGKNRNANTIYGAKLGLEVPLRAAADKLRGRIHASEYKHVVLTLISLRYISDAMRLGEIPVKEAERTGEEVV